MSSDRVPPGTPEHAETWTEDGVAFRLAQSLELGDFVWALPGVVILGLLGFVLGFGAQGLALMPSLTWDGLVASGQLSMVATGAVGSVFVAFVLIYGPWIGIRLLRLREPIDVRIERGVLHLGPDAFEAGAITDAQLVHGSLVLSLEDGQTWDSIAFAPRDPERLERLIRRQLRLEG